MKLKPYHWSKVKRKLTRSGLLIGLPCLEFVEGVSKLLVEEKDFSDDEITSLLVSTRMVFSIEGEGDFFMVADVSKGLTQNHWRIFNGLYPKHEDATRLAVKRLGKPFTV